MVVAPDGSPVELYARLGGEREVALLLSHLVNTDDDDQRAAFLATVARHLAPGGVAIVERHDPRWAATVTDGPLGDRDGVTFAIEGVARHADRLRATSIYAFDGQEMRQAWTARILDDESLSGVLAAAGLRLVDFLDPSRTLARATLAAP